MSRGRLLQPGDDAVTDFNGPGPLAKVRITARIDSSTNGRVISQSGIMFQVDPPLKNGTLQTWYDADWFEAMPK